MEKTISSPTSNGSQKMSSTICYDSDDENDSLLRKKNPSINSQWISYEPLKPQDLIDISKMSSLTVSKMSSLKLSKMFS